ncbi:MAG: MerR family transcriptional regulator [Bacteroidaceae bacterium]|nr:MerR family transcriptional regulator [Bacteroidaceae bacterium]
MALKKEKIQKLYYSIKEVAAMFDVKESLLRYWETEFPHLRPKTTRNNVRQYTDKDIEQIRLIYNLVKVRGFKLSAARRMLNANRDGAEKTAEILESLLDMRTQLQELKKQLDVIV